MNYGFYLSTAGTITGMRRLDTVSNNLANSTTVGFKADILSTRARLPENIENGGSVADTNGMLDALGGGTLFNPSEIDLSQGALETTGNALDVAIEGDGFFVLEAPANAPKGDKFLTRAGHFARDTQGRLVLATNGQPVLDDQGQAIVLPENPANLRIDRDGTLRNGDDEFARLGVVMPADIRSLKKEGRDMIRLIGGRTAPVPADTIVHQNHLEQSTVDPVLTLAELVKVSRGIDFSMRMMQAHDQMTGRLIDTFGRFS